MNINGLSNSPQCRLLYTAGEVVCWQTNLQFGKRYDVSIGRPVPHSLLAYCIVVIEAGSLLIKEFPPLVTV